MILQLAKNVASYVYQGRKACRAKAGPIGHSFLLVFDHHKCSCPAATSELWARASAIVGHFLKS